MKAPLTALGILIVATAAPVAAQRPQPPQQKRVEIPVEYRPPAGLCRIWIEGVPPAQQPAPTDCPTAVRNRPENGQVIFGDDYLDRRAVPTRALTDTTRRVVPVPLRPTTTRLRKPGG